MKIYIGADHNGFELKKRLIAYLQRNGYDVSDEGDLTLDPEDDYPLFAAKVVMAMKASQDREPRGLLICGSGQGICIAANRFKGIRAAVCSDPDEARSGRNDDDTNVLCLPARQVDGDQAETIVRAWLDTGFAGAARFKRRIVQLDELG
jgi:ribose 5-phosphate isomerase B